MKTQTYTAWIAMGIAAAMVACTPHPQVLTKVPVSRPHTSDRKVAAEVYQEVNAYRRSRGAQELQRHPGLDALAQGHCEYLRQHRGTFTLEGKNVSHIGIESRSLLARRQYHMESISENVAAANPAGGKSTSLLMRLWKESKDHHKNMLEPWTHTGVGVVVDADGTAFATEIFATVSSARVMTLDRFNRY